MGLVRNCKNKGSYIDARWESKCIYGEETNCDCQIKEQFEKMTHLIQYRRDLYTLFPSVEDAVCVELGVAEGQFSRDMCVWGVKLVISVDLWESRPSMRGDIASSQAWHDANYKKACDLLRPFGGQSKILRGSTTAMAQYVPDDSCDLVYIDADHSYEGVKNDIAAWWGKVKIGGIVGLHDFKNSAYGVNQAATEFARDNNLALYVTNEDKAEDAGCYFFKR